MEFDGCGVGWDGEDIVCIFVVQVDMITDDLLLFKKIRENKLIHESGMKDTK